ncbi:hypothetical protein [Paraburkholderia megapolitana]|nr:hypothetical protein [Paraburkholderia megapolitana]
MMTSIVSVERSAHVSEAGLADYCMGANAFMHWLMRIVRSRWDAR